MNPITYSDGQGTPILDEVIDLYKASTIRRPTSDRVRMAKMLKHSNLIVTAWDKKLLVGISRAFSDFAFVTYLADLVVRDTYQKRGIGRDLTKRTKEKGGSDAQIVLLAAPEAIEFYPKIGFVSHPSAWVRRRKE